MDQKGAEGRAKGDGARSLDDGTRTNKQCSPLLKMPAELRNEIYKHICFRHVIKPYTIKWSRYDPASLGTTPHISKHQGGSFLLHVCRQIRQEAMPMFYDLSTFHFLNYQIGENMVRFLGQETSMALRSISYLNTSAYYILLRELKHPEKGQELMESFRKDLLSLEHVYLRESCLTINYDGDMNLKNHVGSLRGGRRVCLHIKYAMGERESITFRV